MTPSGRGPSREASRPTPLELLQISFGALAQHG